MDAGICQLSDAVTELMSSDLSLDTADMSFDLHLWIQIIQDITVKRKLSFSFDFSQDVTLYIQQQLS